MTDAALLALESVSVRYGAVQVLADVSIHVQRGSFVGLIGPNGAGKTTLFNAVSGFTRPRSGVVRFTGRDITGRSPHARARLGIVRTFQNVGLNKGATVEENMLTALTVDRPASELRDVLSPFRLRPERGVAMAAALEDFELTRYRTTRVRDLSTGTAKMVELACATLREPTLLLLDEPSSGLSPEETSNLASVLCRLHDRGDLSILMIEHDMSLVSRTARYVYCLEFGNVISAGTPAEVRADERVIEAYLGESG